MPGIVLMENAGRGCVDRLESLGVDGPVAVLCGKGNNAGDGFVIARHLLVRGHECRVALGAPPSELQDDALAAFNMLTPLAAPILDLSGVNPALMIEELDAFCDGAHWLVDALLGTGASGPPRPPFDSLIDWMNAEPANRLAVDLPSGLDCDTGAPAAPTVKATATCTFLRPKAGFLNPEAQPYLGQVFVTDIGVPADAQEA